MSAVTGTRADARRAARRRDARREPLRLVGGTLVVWLLLAVLCGLAAPSAPARAQGDIVEDLLGGGAAEPAEPAAERTIETDSDADTDAEIRRRLEGIFAELEPSREVTVEVAEGIVKLGGTAASSAAAERTIAIAEAVAGVVEVVDGMEVDTNVGRRLSQTLERLRQSTLDGLAALPVLAVALATLAAFWFLGRWVGGRRGLFSALAPNGFIAELLSGIARVAITLVGAIVALTLLDATSLIGTVLGAAGIVGLAVGFAVRDTVENYIASILLSLRTPFLAGDKVAIDGHVGTVARLTSRATVLISIDGNHIRLPNSLVFKAVIVNYSTDPARRVSFMVGIDTEFDPLAAQSLALETLPQVPGVLDSPRPTARVEALGDSNVSLEIAAWVDENEADPLAVRSEVIRSIKQAFDEAGIVMPEPIYRLKLDARGPGGELLRRIGATVSETDADESGGASEDAPGDASGAGDGASREPSAPSAGAADDSAAFGSGRPRRSTADRTAASVAVAEALGGVESTARARDVSIDPRLADTVARERERGAEEDLLHPATPRE